MPPTILTPSYLLRLSTHPVLPKHTWYLITSVTLSMLNRPDEIPNVLAHAFSHGASGPGVIPSPIVKTEEQLLVVRRMREGLLKGAAIGGLPKTINALLTLKSATPPHLLDLPPDASTAPSPTSPTPPQSPPPHDLTTSPLPILARGTTFFNRVYGKISARVMSQLLYSGTPSLASLAHLLYGHVLSDETVLGARDTSFVLVAGLVPQDVNPQLKGHLRGCLNNGARMEEVRAVRDVAVEVCERAGMGVLGAEERGGWGWRGRVENI